MLVTCSCLQYRALGLCKEGLDWLLSKCCCSCSLDVVLQTDFLVFFPFLQILLYAGPCMAGWLHYLLVRLEILEISYEYSKEASYTKAWGNIVKTGIIFILPRSCIGFTFWLKAALNYMREDTARTVGLLWVSCFRWEVVGVEFHLFGPYPLPKQLGKMGGCSDDLMNQKTNQGPFLHSTKKQAPIKLPFLPPQLSTSALSPRLYPPLVCTFLILQ